MPARSPTILLPRPSVHHWFVRRREAWLPTVWGWLLLFAFSASALLVFGRFVNRWLSVDEPAHGAKTLVVEGWMGTGDLDNALRTFRQGGYQRLLTTGGPTYDWPDPNGFPSYADRAADYLRRKGVSADRLIAVPAPASAQDRTFLSAVMVREWAARTGTHLDAIDVFSVGAHTRRSRMVYRLAFGPSVAVGAIPAQPATFDADRWWTTSAGVKAVMGETLSIAWTACCFWPPKPGSHEERWADPEPASGAAASPPPQPP